MTVNSFTGFTKQLSAEIFLTNIFSPVFLRTFTKFLQRIKKNIPNIFKKFAKKTPVAKSYFSKVARFYRSSHRRGSVKKRCSKKGVRENNRKIPVSETLF